MQGHRGIQTGGKYGGIGAQKKEVSVLSLFSTTAGTPLSFVEVLLTFLHPFSEISGAEECVHEFWEGENHPSPTHKYSPRAYTVLRLNCTLWHHDNLTKD